MKEKIWNPSFSIIADDLIIPPSKTIGRKPAGSPPTPSFSDRRTPRPPDPRSPFFSQSFSSISSSPSSLLPTPSQSPFHRLLPSSAIPFSWEHKPGIPKSTTAGGAAAAGDGEKETLLLPLPPVLRSAAGRCRKTRSGAGNVDPFAAAHAQCAKDASPAAAGELDVFRRRRSSAKSVGVWREATIANRLGFYGSCKTTCSVSESTVVVPRSDRRDAGSYGLVNRRSK